MNSTGSVEFGGRIAYCQQNGKSVLIALTPAWIQNATLKDNVVFGQPWNEERYWQALQDASLMPDLEILPDGDLTEVSHKSSPLIDRRKRDQPFWRSETTCQYRPSDLL